MSQNVALINAIAQYSCFKKMVGLDYIHHSQNLPKFQDVYAVVHTHELGVGALGTSSNSGRMHF